MRNRRVACVWRTQTVVLSALLIHLRLSSRGETVRFPRLGNASACSGNCPGDASRRWAGTVADFAACGCGCIDRRSLLSGVVFYVCKPKESAAGRLAPRPRQRVWCRHGAAVQCSAVRTPGTLQLQRRQKKHTTLCTGGHTDGRTHQSCWVANLHCVQQTLPWRAQATSLALSAEILPYHPLSKMQWKTIGHCYYHCTDVPVRAVAHCLTHA